VTPGMSVWRRWGEGGVAIGAMSGMGEVRHNGEDKASSERLRRLNAERRDMAARHHWWLPADLSHGTTAPPGPAVGWWHW
jgi:hypothetical protein